jgi:exodeoxyribonuclease VII small subunit
MTPKPFEFEKALKELENITSWFESSDVDLDQGIAKFEHGMELASELKTHLATIENRVEKIRARFSDLKPQSDSAQVESRPPEQSEEDQVPVDQTDLFGS